MPSRLSGADLDEISTVDIPAHQNADIVLIKRHTQEDSVEFWDQDGEPVDVEIDEDGNVMTDLEDGAVIFDGEGNGYQLGGGPGEDPEDAFDGERELELAGVGKSAFFADVEKGGDELFKSLSEELRKAVDDDKREEILAKALAANAREVTLAKREAQEAGAIAKALADRQLTTAYISKAAEYVLPVAPEELGPVMKRAAEALSEADCAVLHKVFSLSGDIFKSYGLDGEGDPVDDVLAEIEAKAQRVLGKRDGGSSEISKEQATTEYFNEHPEAYREHRANLFGRG